MNNRKEIKKIKVFVIYVVLAKSYNKVVFFFVFSFLGSDFYSFDFLRFLKAYGFLKGEFYGNSDFTNSLPVLEFSNNLDTYIIVRINYNFLR